MKRHNKRGFTIVELVIVIAVIAILAAVLIPTFRNVIDKANKSATLQEARALYEEVLAVDLADGTQDAKDATISDTSKQSLEKKLPDSTVENQFTYSVTTENGKTTISFEFTKGSHKAVFDGTGWKVDPPTSGD